MIHCVSLSRIPTALIAARTKVRLLLKNIQRSKLLKRLRLPQVPIGSVSYLFTMRCNWERGSSFQGLLPIVSGESCDKLIGWITMVQDRQPTRASVMKMVKMPALVFLLCLLVIVPVICFVAPMFSRQIGRVVAGLRDISARHHLAYRK